MPKWVKQKPIYVEIAESWADRPDEFKAIYHDPDKSLQDIAQVLGCHHQRVNLIAKELGIKTRTKLGIRGSRANGAAWTKGKKADRIAAKMTPAKFRKLYHDPNLTVVDVGAKLGCTVDQVAEVAHKLGVELRSEIGLKVNPKQQRWKDRLGKTGCNETCRRFAQCMDKQKAGYTGPVPCEIQLDDELPKSEYDNDHRVYYVSPMAGMST